MRILKSIFHLTTALVLFGSRLMAMPADSTLFWKIPGISPTGYYSLAGTTIDLTPANISPSSVMEIQATVYSDPYGTPGTIEADSYDHTATPRTALPSFLRDRGGNFILIGKSFILSGGTVIGYTNEMDYPTGYGRFSDYAPRRAGGTLKYDNAANPRGWLRIRYIPSGAYSTSQVSQPYAVQTRAAPIGGWAVDQTASPKFVSFAKSNLFIQPNRVLFVQSLDMSYNNGAVEAYESFGGPTGAGMYHPGATTISGSAGAIEYGLNKGNVGTDNENGLNRGFTIIQYLAAQCADGSGGFSEANIGGRTIQAYVNQASSLSTYGGCHGTLNGIHVIESTGDDIWNAADQFRYSYKTGYSGSHTYTVRIDQLENTSDWARAGVVIRAGTGAGDPYIGAFITPGHGLILQGRLSPNASTSQFGTVTVYPGTSTRPIAPLWLQLRYDNSAHTTTAYYKQDSQTSWTAMPGQPLYTFGTYNAGIGAASRSAYPATSVYSNLSGF